MQVAGAGERFVLGRMEADLGRCGCCTLVLHFLRWFEPATIRLRDAPVVSKQVVYLAISAHESVGRRSAQRTLTPRCELVPSRSVGDVGAGRALVEDHDCRSGSLVLLYSSAVLVSAGPSLPPEKHGRPWPPRSTRRQCAGLTIISIDGAAILHQSVASPHVDCTLRPADDCGSLAYAAEGLSTKQGHVN